MTQDNSQTGHKRGPTQRVKDSPLTEADWVCAAIEILVDESVRGIRIDPLCRKLGVTKGSFYWHFRGRAQLLTTLLDTWRDRATTNVIRALTAHGMTAQARLRALLALPHRHRSPQAARIEQAIRDWARRDGQAEAAVRSVDELRRDYFAAVLIEIGLAPDTATRRAYLAYAMMMGDSVLRGTIGSEDAVEPRLDEMMAWLTAPG